MIRASAKNNAAVTILTSPSQCPVGLGGRIREGSGLQEGLGAKV